MDHRTFIFKMDLKGGYPGLSPQPGSEPRVQRVKEVRTELWTPGNNRSLGTLGRDSGWKIALLHSG